MRSARMLAAFCALLLVACSAAFPSAHAAVAVSSVDWAHQTAASIAQVAPAEFATLTANQLSSISAVACGGINAAQVQAVPAAAFVSMSSYCLSNMAADTVCAISGAQSHYLGLLGLTQLTAHTTAHFSADFCSGLRSLAGMASDGSDALLGFTPQCLAALQDMTCNSIDMDTFTPYVRAQQTAHLSALSYTCITSFTCSTWIDLQSFALLPVWQALNASALSKTDQRCMTSAPADWSSLTSATLTEVNPAAFLTLSAATVSTISSSACAGVSVRQMRNFGTDQSLHACSGITPDCFAVLSSLQVIDAACVRSITPQTFAGTHLDTTLNRLPLSAIAVLSSQQFSAIPRDTLRVLSAAQISQLPLDVCANMQLDWLESSSVQDPPQCSGLTAACVRVVPSSSFAGVQGDCMQHMQPSAVAALNSSQAASTPSPALDYLNANSTALFSADYCSGLSGQTLQMWGLSYDGLNMDQPLWGLTSHCLHALSSEACAAAPLSTFQGTHSWLHNFALLSSQYPSGLPQRLSALSAGCVQSLPCDTSQLLQSDASMAQVREALSAPALADLSSRCASHGASKRTIAIAVGCGVGGLCLIVAAVVAYCIRRKAQQRHEGLNAQLLQQQSQGHYAQQHSHV